MKTLDASTALEGRAALARIAEVVRASESSLWLFTDDGARLRCALNHGPVTETIEGISVPVSSSVIGAVATSGLPTSVGQGGRYYAGVDLATRVTTRAMIAAPVRIEGEVVGVLSAINPPGREAFSADELDVLCWKAFELGGLLQDSDAKARV